MESNRSQGLLSMHQVLSLYLPSMLLALGSSMVAPVIPGFAKSFDVSLGTAALVFVAFNFGALAVTFPAGVLIDLVGRKPVLLAGPILQAVGSLMTPFSSSFIELLLWRFVVGAAGQLWQQSRLAIIADTARTSERARQVQWMMGVGRGGQLFGPAVGGFLAAAFGTWIPFAIYAALLLVVVIPSFKLIEETRPDRRRQAESAAAAGTEAGWRGVFAYLLTFQMMVFLAIQVTAQFARGGQDYGSLNLYAVYAYDIGPHVLGLLNTTAIIFGIPVPFITGYLMDRFGRRSVIVPGFLSYAVAVVVMSLTAFLPVPFTFFLASYVLVQVTQGTVGGTMQVMGTDLAPPFARGRFFSIWRMFSQAGSTASPAIFAFIAEKVSYGVGFLWLAFCAVSVAVGVGGVLGNTLARADAAERRDKDKASQAEDASSVKQDADAR